MIRFLNAEADLAAVIARAARLGMPTPMRVVMRRTARQQAKLWPFYTKAEHANLALNAWLYRIAS